MPVYKEYRTENVNPRFACEVQLALGPLTPTRTSVFSTKKDAKQAAAREVVIWLRNQGKLPTPSKRPKIEDSAPLPGNTGLTQAIQEIDMNSANQVSLPARVHEIALMLGFTQPELPVVARNGALVTMAARFCKHDRERDTRLRGDEEGFLAYVRDVRGQKVAKVQCWQQALEILEDISRSKTAP